MVIASILLTYLSQKFVDAVGSITTHFDIIASVGPKFKAMAWAAVMILFIEMIFQYVVLRCTSNTKSIIPCSRSSSLAEKNFEADSVDDDKTNRSLTAYERGQKTSYFT